MYLAQRPHRRTPFIPINRSLPLSSLKVTKSGGSLRGPFAGAVLISAASERDRDVTRKRIQEEELLRRSPRGFRLPNRRSIRRAPASRTRSLETGSETKPKTPETVKTEDRNGSGNAREDEGPEGSLAARARSSVAGTSVHLRRVPLRSQGVHWRVSARRWCVTANWLTLI